MRVILGPMEGVLDHLMREILTDINDYDLCVTEFVRVVDRLFPNSVFYRLCPELHNGGKTRAGTPVRVQILGQDPNWMAENGRRAVELGSPGVDINFGCPAKLVNKSKGGAVLLKEPELIHQIVKSVRQAVDPTKPVTAKIRLGWDDPNHCFEIADAIAQAGADEITVHGRTKEDGYRAEEIKWDYIHQLQQHSPISIVANGEVWNYQDGQQCIATTGTQSLMVCRGAINLPNLGNVIKYNADHMPWTEVLDLLLHYSTFEIKGDKGLYYPNRIKQWFAYLRHEYPQAKALFADIRRHNKAQPIVDILTQARAAL
ncbi:TPA: tRNA dihydrouridine(16) synthase DusC [Photobacterium damselae]|uniref:tRNA-dihydrouridine(16) synthase n=3 Tax=Photobacterium damselae TaxID=38293 RepID=D0YVJ4_PHODD|nr:tRNA dihydrouridine(16) synthase DusC [Photobacterium damselae]EEZ40548.1 tRNA-dihydrouridine synthase C [Photobacterium damselae subsp. damselae CIP 102761]EHA1081238.1 tRNA dihydrouridine(16) synthase DusC [Photobacterium damselae]KAB1183652.1 tRNA dihydrouridine(16) synthase DusC [Photobacterium damselae subsp. damselae]MCG3814337.1 tRNA dihydrouridine(16) synthase DusC [Photobacterium damselae]OEC81923.1 tRNA dihydrouridine synthase DusC [Photobacterium damselae subsp. damselae]